MDTLETKANIVWERFLDSDRVKTHTSAHSMSDSGKSADWERLMASENPSISLGALLLWLQDTPSNEQPVALSRVLANVDPRWMGTAQWLTAGIESSVHATSSLSDVANAESQYNEKLWRALLHAGQLDSVISQLASRSAAMHRLMNQGLLREFVEFPGATSRLVAQALQKTADPTVQAFLLNAMAYPPLLESVLQFDPRIIVFVNPDLRATYRRRWTRIGPEIEPTALAARGFGSEGIVLDIKNSVSRQTSERSARWADYPENPSVLDADSWVEDATLPVDIEHFIGIRGISIVRTEDKGDTWSGLVHWDSKIGEPIIVINANETPTRQRFTLAHEFGHLWLGSVSFRKEYDTGFWSTRDAVEIDANRLASRLLIPRHDLLQQLPQEFAPNAVEGLARRYQVSWQAMAVTLTEIQQTWAVVAVVDTTIRWLWAGRAVPSLPFQKNENLITDSEIMSTLFPIKVVVRHLPYRDFDGELLLIETFA